MTDARRPARFGAVEAGGTKFVCGIGTASGELLDSIRIPTQDPDSTLRAVERWFQETLLPGETLAGLGVGSFGPLDLRIGSPSFGWITTTPKPGWRHTEIAGRLQRTLGCPVSIDTDVNAAALGEQRWGAGRGCESLAYVTVGTGIGTGIIQRRLPIHGLLHPELGHAAIRRHPADVDFAGICPFHGDCLEGLASGPAIIARTGKPMRDLPPEHPLWTIEADYLGQLCTLLVLSHSPQRIILGGGVMQERLIAAVHERLLQGLGGYIEAPELRDPAFLTPPGLGSEAGIRGALALALP